MIKGLEGRGWGNGRISPQRSDERVRESLEGVGRRQTEVSLSRCQRETAGWVGLYVIECIEVNSEIRDQEQARW